VIASWAGWRRHECVPRVHKATTNVARTAATEPYSFAPYRKKYLWKAKVRGRTTFLLKTSRATGAGAIIRKSISPFKIPGDRNTFLLGVKPEYLCM
jgi:hypothetical protein